MPRVLVLDGCEDTRLSLGVLLGHWGFEPFTGRAGLAALERDGPPDAVILDVPRPGGAAAELRPLRERWPRGGTLLMCVSGWGDEKTRRGALDAGADVFLVKPADPVMVQRLLTHFVKTGR